MGGSGEEELETSEVSAAARGGFRGGAVAGITCGDVTGKDIQEYLIVSRRLEEI